SRRRPTSFSRDWSSDVCSSDLTRRTAVMAGNAAARPLLHASFGRGTVADDFYLSTPAPAFDPAKLITVNGYRFVPASAAVEADRSEEPRVGPARSEPRRGRQRR